MLGSLDMLSSPPRATLSSVGLSESDPSGNPGLLTSIADTLRRVRAWRPVQLLAGGGIRAPVRARKADVTAAVPGNETDGDGGRRVSTDMQYHDLEMPPGRWMIPFARRQARGALDGGAGRGRSHTGAHQHGHNRKHGRSHHAVPVSTTRVQDGIKWVNLVRFANLAKLFRPCLLPRNRRRVRFRSSTAQRSPCMTSSCGEVPKTPGDLSTAAVGAIPGSAAATSRRVYILVKQGRHLVWPSFEGLDYSCFCLLLVGGQVLGTTQAVPLPQGGGARGGGGGPGGANSNTVQWNEGFSLPRSCFEGVPDGRMVLEVWSSESVGDDVLVGQTELLLGPMLEAERPHPLSTVLDLQAIDEETGQVEPGTCGELHVAAWVEAEVVDQAAHCPYSSPTASPANLDEAGVVTSNLSAPCGSKSMPQLVHSPQGTLYEEPCVVALKISVVGLVNLSYGTLISGGNQGGMSKRRVRLEAHRSTGNLREPSDSHEPRDMREQERRSLPGDGSGKRSSSLGGGPQGHDVPLASSTATRDMGPLNLDRLRRKQKESRNRLQPQGPRRSVTDKSIGGATAAAGLRAAFGCLPHLAFGSRGDSRRQYGGSRGAAAGGAATVGAPMDELIEEDEDVAATNGTGGGGGGGGGGAVPEDRTLAGDDGDDGSSLALNPSLPLSGMTSEDQGAGAGQGQGVFCYFKVSVDKQSHKSRMRWLPAPPPPPPGLSPAQQLQQLLEYLSVELQPSVFVFTLARPLSNVPIGLAMYVTTSARRRGRVVGRFTIQLYDLLDQVLGTATGGGVPAAQRPNMGVTGKKVEVQQEFEEAELGRVRLIVQLADLDERASLFRLPLVSDPQQLVPEAVLAPVGAGCSALSPSIMMMWGSGVAGVHGGGGSTGDVRHHLHMRKKKLGPVLCDKELLRQVLRRSCVEPDVEDMFFASYARVECLKATGGGGVLQARVNSLRRFGLGSGGGGGGGWHSGRSSAQEVHVDPVRVFNETLAAITTNGAGDNISGAEAAASVPAAAANSILTTLFRNPEAFSATERMSILEHSPGGSLAGRFDGSGGGSGGGRILPTGPGAASGCASHMLGSVVLRIASINGGGALSGSSYCCIVKCGPHWLRTVDLDSSQEGLRMPQWQVIIPLYSPATILTVAIFASSAKSLMSLAFGDNLGLVSRVRLKLSSVRPFRRSWHIVAMYMNGTTGAAAAPGGPPLVAVLGLKLQYSNLRTLIASYLRPTAPESLYELELDADMALKMESDARKISEHWLASAQPPIPPEVAKLLLDDGRMTFNFSRTKNNWRRVKSGMRLLLSVNNWFKHICSWKSALDSSEVVFCIALLCYLPSTACKLFFFMTALRGAKGFMQFRSRVAALVENGAEAAASLLLSPQGATGVAGTDVRGDGAATTAVAAAAGGGLREAAGNIAGITIGGGVEDPPSDDEAGEDSKVPVGTVAEFRRKFAELFELGLLLQNLFDDVASILERMQAIMSFQDVVASCLFSLACILMVGVVALLGFPTTIFLVLLWQVRPPSLRDALPAPPFIYFMKLPCKSATEFG